jgi:hypothetical protein
LESLAFLLVKLELFKLLLVPLVEHFSGLLGSNDVGKRLHHLQVRQHGCCSLTEQVRLICIFALYRQFVYGLLLSG